MTFYKFILLILQPTDILEKGRNPYYGMMKARKKHPDLRRVRKKYLKM